MVVGVDIPNGVLLLLVGCASSLLDVVVIAMMCSVVLGIAVVVWLWESALVAPQVVPRQSHFVVACGAKWMLVWLADGTVLECKVCAHVLVCVTGRVE